MKSLGKQISITVYTLSELKQLYEEAKSNNLSNTSSYKSAFENAKQIIKDEFIKNHVKNKIEEALKIKLLEAGFDNVGENSYSFRYYWQGSFVFVGEYNCYRFAKEKFKKDKEILKVIERCCEPDKFIVYINKDSASSNHAFINSHINFDINKVKDDAKLYDDLSYSIQDIEEDILDCIWDKINCISMDLYELNKELLKPSDEILIEYAAGKYFSTQLKPYFMEES